MADDSGNPSARILNYAGPKRSVAEQKIAPGERSGLFQGILSLIVACIVMPLLFVVAAISIPIAVVDSIGRRVRENELKKRMRARARYLSWPDVEDRIRAQTGTSTLIVVSDITYGFSQAWWTPDDLLSNAPMHPVVEWCWHQYRSEETGTAILTELPEKVEALLDPRSLKGSPFCCRAIYPTLNVVITWQMSDRKTKAATEFVSILGRDIADSIPAIVANLNHANPDIRQMCRGAIQLAGPSAIGAIPALTRQFHTGSRREQWSAAVTLVKLGPPGMAVVYEAITAEDAHLRHTARKVLDMFKEPTIS